MMRILFDMLDSPGARPRLHGRRTRGHYLIEGSRVKWFDSTAPIIPGQVISRPKAIVTEPSGPDS
jgi:hypothetical protein